MDHAIVKLRKLGGHGVLVPGNIILSAAHCINFTTTGGMVLGDYFIEEIETHMGCIKAAPMVVEPVTDIAALQSLDDQAFYEEAQAFEEFCQSTKPIPLAIEEFKCGQSVPVRIRDKDGAWIDGVAEIFNESSPMVWVTTKKETRGGASGGPIVNIKGELVAIISNSSTVSAGKSDGHCPRPLKALPVWVCHEILTHDSREKKGRRGVLHTKIRAKRFKRRSQMGLH